MAKSQKTYKNDEIRVLPANQTVGEGVFIEFDELKIEEWISNMGDDFKERFDIRGPPSKTTTGRLS